MENLTPAAHRSATRARWLRQLEDALDHCDELSRALRTCAKDSKQARQLSKDIEAAKKEVDRIRRARPLGPRQGAVGPRPSGLAGWRGNWLD